MDGVRAWMRSRPLAAFLAIAYIVSWPMQVLALFVFPRSMALQGMTGSIAVFAPAIAAMIVAAAIAPGRVERRRAAFWTAFLVSWALAAATLVLFASRVRGAPVAPPLLIFGALLALLPAFTVSRAFSRTAGVRRYFRTLAVPRGNVLWYLFALFAFPAVQLAGAALTGLFGAGGAPRIEFDPVVLLLVFLHGFFFAGGINEESGWRGFALPLLQERHSPLVAGLTVWFFWALWHLPADIASGAPAASILENRILFNAIWSILFMWVYDRTGGSVLAPALFHPSMNASGEMLPRTAPATVIFVILALVAVLADRMWRGPREGGE